MKYLRHPALAFYVLAVLVAAGVLIGAYATGRHSHVPRLPAADPIALDSQVSSLRERMTDLPNLLAQPSELRSWGAQEASMAGADAAARRSGLGHTDALVSQFRTLAGDAARLGQPGYDTQAAISAVMDDGDALTRLAANPAPGVSDPDYVPAPGTAWEPYTTPTTTALPAVSPQVTTPDHLTVPSGLTPTPPSLPPTPTLPSPAAFAQGATR